MDAVRLRTAALLPLLLLLAAAPLSGQRGGEQVLLTPAEALREVFPAAASYASRPWRPDAAARAALEERLGRPLREAEFPFLAVYDARSRFLGWALVTEERGKYRPITFMVGVAPDGRVQDVAVMVYREDRGGEVRRRRFLNQYRGRDARDPIRIDRDIVNVSGATISVRSVNAGVRKTLAVVETAFGRGAPTLAAGAPLRPIASLR